MGYVAELRGLRPPPAAANLRVNPYLVVQQERRREAAGQPVDVENKVKAGGEVKWAINPHAVLDLTYNTDFAQADADRQVINLRRFNVFFPERRQFFWKTRGYSRRARRCSSRSFRAPLAWATMAYPCPSPAEPATPTAPLAAASGDCTCIRKARTLPAGRRRRISRWGAT